MKPLCILIDIIDAKNNTAICQVEAYRSKCKAIKAGNMKWAIDTKQ